MFIIDAPFANQTIFLFVWIMELALNFDPIIRIYVYLIGSKFNVYNLYYKYQNYTLNTFWLNVGIQSKITHLQCLLAAIFFFAFAMFICCNNLSILSHQNSIKDFARKNFDTQLTTFTLYTKQIRRMHEDKRFINSNKRETGLKTKEKESIWIENHALDYVEPR